MPHAIPRSSETQYGLIRLQAEIFGSCSAVGREERVVMSVLMMVKRGVAARAARLRRRAAIAAFWPEPLKRSLIALARRRGALPGIVPDRSARRGIAPGQRASGAREPCCIPAAS